MTPKPKRGRPPGASQPQRIALRLADDLHARLAALAAERGVKLSQLVRDLLAAAVASGP